MLYDIKKSWAENLAEGPQFYDPIPEPVLMPHIEFLGYTVASPIGVPAGPLLDSRWTTLAAHLGYDIVTYKTIRTKEYLGHPLPNVIYVEPYSPTQALESIFKPDDISITNSFGMPSMSQAYLSQDIALAKKSLNPHQLLIVSVVGSPGNAPSVIEDFAACAKFAKECGADIVEANFSCPNICSKEGALFTDPENSFLTAAAIVKAIHPLPLLVKVGCYKDNDLMRKVILKLAQAGVHGICGINSVSMNVIDSAGQLALGSGRESSGICGDMIRDKAMQFVRNARDIIRDEKLDMELAGCGGLMKPEHFTEMLSEGAKIVLTATGMMWNPYLARDWKLSIHEGVFR